MLITIKVSKNIGIRNEDIQKISADSTDVKNTEMQSRKLLKIVRRKLKLFGHVNM